MTIDTSYAQFELPPTVQARLQHLLDQQDSAVQLTELEQREAVELVDLAEFLSLLKLRAERLEKLANAQA